MTVLLVTSLLPGPSVRTVSDLAQHAVAYAGLTGVFWWAAPAADRRWLAGPAAWGYGVVLELLQRAVPYRTSEVRDVAANGVGVLVAMLIALGLSRRREPPGR
ncbi:MAG: VanZ family protein [Armatimonadota bacterium]|nr:VanZ family protein [Armatimonadota bacterium]MDR7532813.1 VanZ family protein [Armatimonadota bacterium]MDR7535183.1 VanZ family protein [Armatimonadota bacterium]